jgi:2-dehydro-3-deoxyphosphogluconate aldolase/(4S)-4-hydroxy-2-oxoglutarate aldolase
MPDHASTADRARTAAARPALPAPIVEGRVIAIARRLEPATLPAVAEALAANGIRVFEVTIDSPGAVESIRALAEGPLAERLLVGAGTVLSVGEAEAAVAAGARFLVTPHLDPELIGWAAERGIPILPGAFTPTEIVTAWRAGAAAVKLFPASVAGPAFIRDFRGPFPDIPLIPTGGVSVENAADFLRAGAVAVGLGSWLTGAGDPAEVARRAAAVAEVVAGVVRRAAV